MWALGALDARPCDLFLKENILLNLPILKVDPYFFLLHYELNKVRLQARFYPRDIDTFFWFSFLYSLPLAKV